MRHHTKYTKIDTDPNFPAIQYFVKVKKLLVTIAQRNTYHPNDSQCITFQYQLQHISITFYLLA